MSAQHRISNERRAVIRGQRALEMAEKYQAGATLQEIGDYFNLTRERVRQLMTRELGIRRQDGGVAARTAARDAARASRRHVTFIRKYGLSEADFRHAQSHLDRFGKRPMDRYRSQQGNADTRGIEWKLTFGEWWQIWQQSGKWQERGRGHGYVMARHGDTGAYEIGNVKIIPGTENQREYIRRYWKQVRSGARPQPKNAHSARYQMEIGETKVLPITQSKAKYADTAARQHAKRHGWKFSVSTRGGVLTVTRLA